MQLKQLMTAHVELIHPDTTVHEAARVMQMFHIGALPVAEGSQLRGILTERDLVARVLAEGRDPTRTTVRDVMTAELIACVEDQDSTEALRLMQERQIRHLAVVDHTGRLVGLLSLRDLAPPLREEQLAGSAIRWPA
jgi:CBS domain-containing protein